MVQTSDPMVICIVGPTASGKTGLSVELAERLGAEIISCDSMQLYRGMDIGTAKPSLSERRGIPHHMLDCVDPAEDYSVGRYVTEADACLQQVLGRGRPAVIVGGTGLYADSLILGREFAPAPASGARDRLKALRDEQGIEAVLELLRRVDPERAEKLHPADEKRILRAAEIWLETGKTATEHDAESRALPPKYRALWIGLRYADRQLLYDRINLRVEMMLEQGLEAELDALLAAGVPETCTAMQAIGYKELLAVRKGLCTRAEAVAAIQQGSRRYAKRQLSWFRRNPDIHWLEPDRCEAPGGLTEQALALVREAFPAFVFPHDPYKTE